MENSKLRDLVKASNPVSHPSRLLPDNADVQALFTEITHRTGNPQPSADLLEQPVERRRDMQTQEKPIQIVREPRTPRSRRRLIPALAGAIAVIVIAVGVVALTGNDESDTAVRSPLEVTELFDEYVVTANWSATPGLFTADATWQLRFVDGESPLIRLSDELPATSSMPDWDGDGTITEMDGLALFGAEVYAGGVTDLLSCSQPDAATAVCDEIREGYAFKQPTHSATWTLTFTDGLINNIVVDLVGQGTDDSALRAYGPWVKANYPELADDLIVGFSERKLNPETIETHRTLVAEWQAQR